MNSNAVYINRITYTGGRLSRSLSNYKQQSISVIGIDTEADPSGKCFMIATELRDVFDWEEFPDCFFGRKYRNKTFVAYNLSYDAGHFVRWLPNDILKQLWRTGTVEYKDYTVKSIPKKFLRITKGKKNSITFYDMLNFYRGAGVNGKSDLDSVGENMLGIKKVDIGTKSFTKSYIKKNYDKIAEYCIRDAEIVGKLGRKIIKQFEEWGVYPRALYSTAYITYQYFSKHTNYVTVRRFWHENRMLLDYAMQSYNGGKFEVTRKGCDYYYEYDIVSAYPYEIANLIDISECKVKYSHYYDDKCTYAFIKCMIHIPPEVYSPVAVKWGAVNIYPVGNIVKVLTKAEYEYLLSVGCTIQVVDAYLLYVDKVTYPYREEILRLFEYKKEYKKTNNIMLYHIIKILLNSLYGKFVQIIKNGDKWITSTCWNPIYGAIITANTRIRVSSMQQKYDSVVAVHTDSIISTKPLDIKIGKELGDWDYEREGDGLILGSGIYQIGEMSKFRGFIMKDSLINFCNHNRSKRRVYGHRVLSWREAMFRGYPNEMVNRFMDDNKWLNVQFDKKRLWPNDYKTLAQALKRKVWSCPHLVDFLDSLLS